MARGQNMPPANWRNILNENRVKKAAEVAALKLEGVRAAAQQHRQIADHAEAEAQRLEAVVNSASE